MRLGTLRWAFLVLGLVAPGAGTPCLDFELAQGDGSCLPNCGITYDSATHYLPDRTCSNRIPQRCGAHCTGERTGGDLGCTNANRGCKKCRFGGYDLHGSCEPCGALCQLGEYPSPASCSANSFPEPSDRAGQGCLPCSNRGKEGVIIIEVPNIEPDGGLCKFICKDGYYRSSTSTCTACYLSSCDVGQYHTICSSTDSLPCKECVIPQDATATSAGRTPGDPYGCDWQCSPDHYLSADGSRCVPCTRKESLTCSPLGSVDTYPVECPDGISARCEPCPAGTRQGTVMQAVLDAPEPYCQETCAPGWRFTPDGTGCERCVLPVDAEPCPSGYAVDACQTNVTLAGIPSHCQPCHNPSDPSVHAYVPVTCEVVCKSGFYETGINQGTGLPECESFQAKDVCETGQRLSVLEQDGLLEKQVFCVACSGKPETAVFTGQRYAEPQRGIYVALSDSEFRGRCAFACDPGFYFDDDLHACTACTECGLGQFPLDPFLHCSASSPALACADCDSSAIPSGAHFLSRYDPTCPWRKLSDGVVTSGESAAYIAAGTAIQRYNSDKTRYIPPDPATAIEMQPQPLSDLRTQHRDSGAAHAQPGHFGLYGCLFLLWNLFLPWTSSRL